MMFKGTQCVQLPDDGGQFVPNGKPGTHRVPTYINCHDNISMDYEADFYRLDDFPVLPN